VYPIFKVELHSKDLPLLNQIKSFFGVGTITVQKTRDSAYYSVNSGGARAEPLFLFLKNIHY